MRVMFDSQIFCHQRFGGVSRYFASTALAMSQLDGVEPLIVAPVHVNEYLESLPRRLVFGRRFERLENVAAGAVAFAAGLLPSRIVGRRFRPDILHHTYYVPGRGLPGAKRVLTVYDMIQERYPNYVAASGLIARGKAACIARADHVICISENTRRDLLNAYPIAPERVSVTHLGCDPLASLLGDESPGEFRTRTLGADAEYILFVGSRVGYKNFSGLLRAYAASAWLRGNFRLVCFGGGEFTPAERAAIAAAGVADRVQRVGGSDAVLAGCYRHAALFVYPSQYEGFGIPPLEAMSLDCPVACSDTSSMPEVVGDAARLFDPADAAAIGEAMQSVLGSPAAAAELVRRGRIRHRDFSWAQCARRTVETYRMLLGT